jgi:hypothetical protein
VARKRQKRAAKPTVSEAEFKTILDEVLREYAPVLQALADYDARDEDEPPSRG